MKKSIFTLKFISFMMLVIGFVLACLSIAYDEPILDTIACCCLALCVLPFVSLQFFMAAGIHVNYFSDLPAFIKLVFFIILFPFANLWLLTCSNVLWHFIPPYNTMDLASKTECVKVLLIYSTSLSFLLGVPGLIIRFLKFRKKIFA